MKLPFFSLVVLLLLASCGKNSRSATDHQQNLQSFEEKQIKNINFAYRPKYPQPTRPNPKTFSKNFCQFVSSNPNPFEIEKYISNDQSLQMLSGQLGYLGQNSLNCKYKQEIYDHYPLQLVEYETNAGYYIYVHFLYDSNYSIAQTSISLQQTPLSVDHIQIPMRDGNSLSTFVFRNSNNHKGTVLIRTPYFHTGPMYLSMADSFLRQGFHVAIQSNRGSHLSDGEFKWLSKQNTQDAYDTIEFIAKQSFSNGKIVSYGVSYDGFNALASGVDNPPSLAGIIACSAPANAATDSFTSNMTTEAHLLSYIWERETNSPIKFFMQKYLYLKSAGIPQAEFDNKIFGRDVGDWDDFLADQQQYFNDRSILEGLNKINVPTIHVAGLTNDQDGRDTILAFESLQKNALNKDMHRMLLHDQGHGCGTFSQGSEFTTYLNLASHAPPTISGSKVRQYAKSIQGYIEGDQYPIMNDFTSVAMSLPAAIDGLHQQLRQNSFSDEPIGFFYDAIQPLTQSYTQNTFVMPVSNKMFLSGTPKLKLKALVTAPGTVIFVDVMVIRPDGSTKTLNQTQRSGVVWNKNLNNIEEVEITLPPTLSTLTADSQIIVQLSTQKSWIIAPQSHERDIYYSQESYGPVVVFEGSELMLPTETVSSL